MAKVVYNACHGGFGLSAAAIKRAREISGNPRWGGGVLKGELYDDGSGPARFDSCRADDMPRHDPVLVQIVEELGDAANGAHAALRIEEVQSGERYRIDEYDGAESVMKIDDYQWTVAP